MSRTLLVLVLYAYAYAVACMCCCVCIIFVLLCVCCYFLGLACEIAVKNGGYYVDGWKSGPLLGLVPFLN